MASIIRSLLRFWDIFPYKSFYQFNGSDSYGTVLGGLVSTIINYGVFLLQVWFIMQILRGDLYSVQTTEDYLSSKIILSKKRIVPSRKACILSRFLIFRVSCASFI